MRLITFERFGKLSLGSWMDNDELIVDLAHAADTKGIAQAPFYSMLALIEAGEAAWQQARSLTQAAPRSAILPTAECRIHAPLPRPPLVRDFLVFEEHVINSAKVMIRNMADRAIAAGEPPPIDPNGEWKPPRNFYDRPIYYLVSPLSISGPGDDIVRPAFSTMFDFELEWAAVIGKPGKDIARDKAADYIFGYTIYNDWSARDEQAIYTPIMLGPAKGKDFDQGVTLGPCIVTPDELGDLDLKMEARVNGEQLGSGRTGAMHHSFFDIVASVSRATTLYGGEVLGSGTVGTGCGMEHGRYLSPGDVVELEIEGIGVLRNRVVDVYDDDQICV